MSRTYKLAFMGEPGSGKTTCIASISDEPPVCTDVACSDELLARKATTTVALDYGELDLGDEGRLLLYGLPGQSRFRYMFEVVREGLLGVVILVDSASPEPLAGLRETLLTHARELRQFACVVALNKNPGAESRLPDHCQALMREFGLIGPVISADVRERSQVVNLFRLLLLMLEHGPEPKQPEEIEAWL